MLQNIQNVDSVFQLHAGNTAGMLMAADPAHCVCPRAHLCLGTWPSYPVASGKQSPGLLGTSPKAGTRRSPSFRERGERLSRREVVVGTQPTRTRTAGNPPAPIWAALVIQRAVTT